MKMTKISNSDDEKKMKPDDAIGARATEDPADGDTEGHMFQPDYGTSRHIANSRNAEIERQAKDRQRQKEAEARNQRR
jgi:hypothetical protein